MERQKNCANSDVHLGHIFNASFMKDAAQKINALGPDIVVITGDLFDGTDGSLDSFTDSLNSINAPDGIYYVTGIMKHIWVLKSGSCS